MAQLPTLGPREIVRLLLLVALTPPRSVAAQPTNLEYCSEDQFALGPGPYLRARPAAGAKPARVDADDSCISGDDLAQCRRIPLEVEAAWTAGVRAGDWICLSDGERSGWVAVSEVVLETAPERARADWLGTWERERGSGTLTIRSAKDGKALEVSGKASWVAGPDSEPHVGDFSDSARPTGVELVLGDPRCVAPDRADKTFAIAACLQCNARLLLVGQALLVADNRNCGGMNVNFDGVYHRARSR